MNRALMIWLSVATLAAVPARGQGAFQNLDFQAAQLVSDPNGPYGPWSIATTNALPGWSAFSGATNLSVIPYNDGLGYFPVELNGSNVFGIPGNFVVNLNYGGSIRQTGVVPADVESLFFQFVGDSLAVSLGGQNLSYVAISAASTLTVLTMLNMAPTSQRMPAKQKHYPFRHSATITIRRITSNFPPNPFPSLQPRL